MLIKLENDRLPVGHDLAADHIAHFTNPDLRSPWRGHGSMKPYRAKARISNRDRQAVVDLVHLRCNTGPEIGITAVVHAPADVSS
jgi:hypothetical protein